MFDGDEGALHVPQSLDAVREVAGLMAATCNLMNAQNNKNSAAVVFDALTGNYILTLPETRVEPETYYDIIAFLENQDGLATLQERLERFYVPEFSGRALFSSILPPDFYYRKGDVFIRDGVLISGTITKAHIGSAHGNIIQALFFEYGKGRTVEFLTDIYQIGGKFLNTHGFSVGIDDCFLTGDNPQKMIDFEIQRAKMLAKSMGVKLLDPLEEERRENQVMAYLNTAKELGAKITKQYLKSDNALNVMAKSGAKGSTHNISQITGILGQQYIKGQRLPESISGGTRALPYFPENDIEPESRGFIVNSFLSGLTPAEYFAAAGAGREGLTDVAISTGTTGHAHHKINKALEDIKVYNDGSVRNAFGVVFQFAYGDDGFNPSMLEQVNTKTGTFASFINVKRLTGKINSKYGYATPGDPEPEFKETMIEKKRKTFVKPKPLEGAPEVPILGISVKIGDNVKTNLGIGKIKEIDGDRVLVVYMENGIEKESWVEVDKIEKIE